MTWFLTIIGIAAAILTSCASDNEWKYFCLGGLTVGSVWLLVHLIDKMRITISDILALGIIVWLITQQPAVIPPPNTRPAPKPPFFPWREQTTKFIESTGVGPGDVEVLTDIPVELRKQNIASKGLGCCVFRSLDHSAKYSQTEALYDFPEWMVRKGIEGGGYPSKVDDLIKKIVSDRNADTVHYIQHTGGDEKFLDEAIKTGRPIAVTYAGQDPRYGLKTGIDHMVNLVYLDEYSACILDNNFIDKYLWMPRDEFLKRWKDRGGGWAVILLDPPAPQPPMNP